MDLIWNTHQNSNSSWRFFLKHVTNSGGIRREVWWFTALGEVFQLEEYGDRRHTVKGDKGGSGSAQKWDL